MRGVYSLALPDEDAETGSSPHARGLHGHQGRRVVRAGIIPACAGFTPSPCRTRTRRRDHPRMRGVYRRHAYRDPGRPGIIPACAGFTAGELGDGDGGQDHPRMRGVYTPVAPA